jgi:hypothetical protein
MFILKIDPQCYHDDESSCCDDIEVRKMSLGELLDAENEYALSSLGYVRVKKVATLVGRKVKDRKFTLSDQAVKTLLQHGWVHSDTVTEREEKKKFVQKYYMVDDNGYPHRGFSNPSYHEVDPSNLNHSQLEQLAKGARIVQVVETESVLTAEGVKRFKELKKSREEQAQKLTEARKAKTELKRKVEIEKAKKLLAEAGEF